ncbi:NAD-dependent deacetylase sirtuin-2 [Mycena maculata]|uniref:NAD-dependent deacetylase sirtuin-2 n=1 Tax=Mycena maculata TaxID=230809 RepID=A0AAD7ILJ8_9AGAR|nr:NAD-dependent deacetylase sirtuin-2 [Mycena maculata]
MSALETHEELVARMLARVPSEPYIKTKDIDGIVQYMKSPQCNKILVMAGAGISTAAGIPDFRSPGTGLYAVFELGYLLDHPDAFYTLARELRPERFWPTVTHLFIKLLADKDCLERRAGIPAELIIEAHGSFATQHCLKCKQAFPDSEFAAHLRAGTIPRCVLPASASSSAHLELNSGEESDVPVLCHGLVKPDIVFFGEPLPRAFFDGFPHTLDADLLLIMGTSLKVHPFASLADMGVCPRVLVNRDPAGDIGTQPDDVVLLMNCDDAVRQIAQGMGWEAELEALVRARTALPSEAKEATAESEDANLQRIVANVSRVVGMKKPADDVDELLAELSKLDLEMETKAGKRMLAAVHTNISD